MPQIGLRPFIARNVVEDERAVKRKGSPQTGDRAERVLRIPASGALGRRPPRGG